MAHQLQNSWTLWEHKDLPKGADWSTSMQKVCEFNTVEEFWKNWAFVPRPSEVFSSGSTRKELEGRNLNAFSMFKSGIKPEWEDAANSRGSELTCRKTMSSVEIDGHWENLVLALIGEVIDENDEVCGCRVVDKTKRSTTRPIFRLELWLRSCNEELGERIKQRMLEALADGDKRNPTKLPFELNKR